MNPDLEKLISLQEADLETARVKNEIAALPRRVTVIEQEPSPNEALHPSTRLKRAEESVAEGSSSAV